MQPESDSPITVTFATGEDARLVLPENPGTGYRWTLAGVPAAVRIGDDRYEGPSSARPGGGGERVFVLTATTPGRYDFAASLTRAWEDVPVEKRSISLIVS